MIGGTLPLGIVSTWLTPMWLLGLGVSIGLLVLAAAYGLSVALSPRLAAFARMSVREGILLPLLIFFVVLSAFTLLSTPAVNYRSLLETVGRISAVGTATTVVEVPGATDSFEIPFPFRVGELQGFELKSDEPLTVYTFVAKGAGREGEVNLTPGKVFEWRKAGPGEPIFPPEYFGNNTWRVHNLGDKPAKLDILIRSDIEFPEVRIVVWTAASVIGLVALYLAIGLAFPKLAAIAATTSKESMGQPIFYIILGAGSFLLLLFVIIPYNTFGEDVKVLKDTGLTAIMLMSIFVAVWSASVSVSEEIEGRTALTLLSKPVQRREFILGKFVGIIWPVVLIFVVLGVLLLLCVSFKVVYDARESAKQEPIWEVCYWEMIRTVPGLILAFFEAVILAAISVALSTRLSMLANLMCCAAVYVLGHLVPMLVNSSVGKFPIVRFVAQLLATVLPQLDHLNIQAAIAAGSPVPVDYLGWALAYTVLYSTIAMLVALALFEDRDLA